MEVNAITREGWSLPQPFSLYGGKSMWTIPKKAIFKIAHHVVLASKQRKLHFILNKKA